MTFLSYLLQVNIYLVLFGLFYIVFLRKETFFQMNRIFILSSSVFSLAIPVLRIEWLNSFFRVETIENTWTKVYLVVNENETKKILSNDSLTAGDYITLIYLLVAFLLCIRFIYNLSILFLYSEKRISNQAFSFFNYISIDKNSAHFNTIMKHEQAHAKQLHSADILFFEILKILNWFNPVIYFYKKEIKHLHEFIADDFIIMSGMSRKKYMQILFEQNFHPKTNPLTNPFFNQSLLKRRIIMLQKNKSHRIALIKYGFCAPLFLIALLLSSSAIAESKPLTNLTSQTRSILTVKEVFKPLTESGEAKKPVIKHPKREKPIVLTTLNDEPKNLYPLYKFLLKNLVYPADAKAQNSVGKIIVKVEIGEDGLISGYSTSKNTSIKAFEDESYRALKKYKETLEVKKGTYNILFNFVLKSDTETIADHSDLSDYGKPSQEIVIAGYTDGPPSKSIHLNAIPKKELIYLNGKRIQIEELHELDPKEMESIIVLKGESATKKYGEEGTNGVFEIKTKVLKEAVISE